MNTNDLRGTSQVAISDFYTIGEVGRLLHLNKATVYRLAHRKEDPLPARRLLCKKRGAVVAREELQEWVMRNCGLIGGSESPPK